MRHTRTRELPGNDASRAFPLQSYQVPRTNHFWLNERAAHISPFPSGVLCASQQKNSLIMNLIPWTWADFRYFSCRFHRVFHHINTGAGKKHMKTHTTRCTYSHLPNPSWMCTMYAFEPCARFQIIGTKIRERKHRSFWLNFVVVLPTSNRLHAKIFNFQRNVHIFTRQNVSLRL